MKYTPILLCICVYISCYMEHNICMCVFFLSHLFACFLFFPLSWILLYAILKTTSLNMLSLWLLLVKDCQFCFLLTLTQMLSNQNCSVGCKNLNGNYSCYSLFQKPTYSESWSALINALLQIRKSSFIDWS